VDEDWLDESLRGLQQPFFLVMAAGSRCYSNRTQNVRAKLEPSLERGNVVNVRLLWDEIPQTLSDLPIRHLLPTHPSTNCIGDAVTVIRGDLKGQTRIIREVAGEVVTTREPSAKKAKKPDLKEHSIVDLVLSLIKKTQK
jgi:hypothetical protein